MLYLIFTLGVMTCCHLNKISKNLRHQSPDQCVSACACSVFESLRAHQQDDPSALAGVFAGASTPPVTVCFFTALAAEFAVTHAKSLSIASAIG